MKNDRDPSVSAERLRDIRLYLFDLDGTLYLGEKLFGFTKDLLAQIRRSGADYMFMTNNSSKSVDAYLEKFRRLGISANKEDFVTSAQATAHHLQKQYPDAVLYVFGTESLKEEMRSAGFRVTEVLSEVEVIVVGFDTELTFRKLDDVCRLLSSDRELPYIATHPDSVCPTEYGSVPDCGSLCDMIFNATGKRPVVIGKPQPLMPQLAMERKGVSPSETAVIGDRIYTDVMSGIHAGAFSILVMTGETTERTLHDSPDKPDLVLLGAGDILPYLK